MSKVFYDKPIIKQIFEEFEKYENKHDKEKLLNLVERLLPEDVNTQDNYGDTALLEASWYNNTEIVKLLLEKEGINVNTQNDYGDTALISASSNGYTEIVKLLLEKEGIDVNIQNKFENTALILASNYGYTEIVQLLENYQKKLIYS